MDKSDKRKDMMEEDMQKALDDFKEKLPWSTDKPPKKKAAPPPEEAAAPRTYVVKGGDSLSKIAKEVYGDASRWREIFEANKDQIKDPNLIRPGWELRIP